MTWAAAMRWALIRAKETGIKRRVYGYRQHGPMGEFVWAYAVGKNNEDGCE